MKKNTIFLLLILLLITCVSLCSCDFFGGNNSGNDNTSEVIQFRFHDFTGFDNTDFYDVNTNKLKVPTKIPVREGYDFDGWYMNKEYTIALKDGATAKSPINIYAKWKTALLDILIYDEINGNTTIPVEYGKKLKLNNPTESAGMTFVGFYTDKEKTKEYNESTIVQESFSLYVKWEYTNFTLTFETYGGVIRGEIPNSFAINKIINLPTSVEKESNVFDGWYENSNFSGTKITTTEKLKANTTLYAKYICDLSEMFATIASTVDGTDAEICISADAAEINLRKYFDFSQNATYVIKDKDGTVCPDNIISIPKNTLGSSVEYVFTVIVTSESGITSKAYNLTINQYDDSVIIVSYYSENGGTLLGIDRSIKKGEIITISTSISAPDKTDYVFAWWSENKVDEYAFGQSAVGAVDLYAVYTPVEYNISYVTVFGKNATSNVTSYNVESEFTFAAPTALPDGYNFVGWYDGENKITKLDGDSGNKTLVARYKRTANPIFEIATKYVDDTFTITKSEYSALMNYIILNKLSSVDIVITDCGSKDEYAALKTDIEVPFSGYSLSSSTSYSGNEANVNMTITYKEEATTDSPGGAYTQMVFPAWVEIVPDRAETYEGFAINYVDSTVVVETSDQLFFVLQCGFRPICKEGSIAETIYAEAKSILRDIIKDGMTEKEKAIAISEYLVKEVAYDHAVLELFSDVEAQKTIKKYRSFYLEGALLDKLAVCDGISKAFVVLCAIEGIKSIQVDGTHGGANAGHAWNKAYVDVDGNGTREWTAIDCTSANASINGMEVICHAYLFATDAELVADNYTYNNSWYDGDNLKYAAILDNNIYKAGTFEYDGETYDYYIENQSELNVLLAFYKELYDMHSTECVVIDYCVAGDFTEDYQKALSSAGFIGASYYLSSFDINSNAKILFISAKE